MHLRSRVGDTGRLFLLFAILFCVVFGATTTAQAQKGPSGPPGPPEADPVIVDFVAIQYPGEDNWLVSGQIVGCSDPEDIDVEIDGVVSASVVTDVFGFFEVVVTYSGGVDMIVADADYDGLPLDTAFSSIGF